MVNAMFSLNLFETPKKRALKFRKEREMDATFRAVEFFFETFVNFKKGIKQIAMTSVGSISKFIAR
jgi:hypothetical protein